MENCHAKVQQKSVEEGRPSHARVEARQAEKWREREESNQPPPGDRDRHFRSAAGRGEGSEEAVLEIKAVDISAVGVPFPFMTFMTGPVRDRCGQEKAPGGRAVRGRRSLVGSTLTSVWRCCPSSRRRKIRLSSSFRRWSRNWRSNRSWFRKSMNSRMSPASRNSGPAST
jgi:hypothetical protein